MKNAKNLGATASTDDAPRTYCPLDYTSLFGISILKSPFLPTLFPSILFEPGSYLNHSLLILYSHFSSSPVEVSILNSQRLLRTDSMSEIKTSVSGGPYLLFLNYHFGYFVYPLRLV